MMGSLSMIAPAQVASIVKDLTPVGKGPVGGDDDRAGFYIQPQKLDQRLRWKTNSPMESYESEKE